MRDAGLLAFFCFFGTLPMASASPGAAPRTLAQTLMNAPSLEGVALAVGAERVTLPAGSAAPEGNDLDEIAAAFGEETQTFGEVTAVAPPTMTVLNDDPAAPDVASDLTPRDAFKLLAAGLSDPQWQALTSENGLGLSDLEDDAQRGLFQALFPHGRLFVASDDPALSNLPDAQRADVQDVSEQIGGARLRLGQTAHLYLHDTQGATIFFSGSRPDAAGRRRIWTPKQDPPPQAHGVTLRAVLPNTPKPGDLDWDSAALQASVPLSGLKTVDDLVRRAAARTKCEIYADPHYAARKLTLRGPAPSAPAGDLLRALALCVTGTYRQVGPAYVLTDDRAGVGARRRRLADWMAEADFERTALRDQAGAALLARRVSGARALPSLGDPFALTPTQMQTQKSDETVPELPSGFDNHVPVAQLTSAQQAWARHLAEEYVQDQAKRAEADAGEARTPDLKGQIDLRAETQVQLALPSLAAPIQTRFASGPMFLLFWPGEAAAMEKMADRQALKPPVPPLPPAPPPASVLRSRPRRAVLGHPRSRAEVDALLAAMQKVGLNELWLDVFSGGVAHVPGCKLSPPSLPSDGPDILDEALLRAPASHVAVYADLSLLLWGNSPPDAVRDLTIEGETSMESAIRAHERAPAPEYDDLGKLIPFAPPPLAISPVSAMAREELLRLARLLAAKPGLAGFVWEDAETDTDLGYTPKMRLAFLRDAHADPLDITPEDVTVPQVSLPVFDDSGADAALRARWSAAQTEAVTGLLRTMRQAIQQIKPSLTILMEQSAAPSAWLASWDDAKSLPPPQRELSAHNSYPDAEEIAALAQAQGRTVLWREGVENDGDTESLARALKSDLSNRWRDGYVLDFRLEEATQGRAPLDSLVRAVSLPSARRKKDALPALR